jgi:hypothetical protein
MVPYFLLVVYLLVFVNYVFFLLAVSGDNGLCSQLGNAKLTRSITG